MSLIFSGDFFGSNGRHLWQLRFPLKEWHLNVYLGDEIKVTRCDTVDVAVGSQVTFSLRGHQSLVEALDIS